MNPKLPYFHKESGGAINFSRNQAKDNYLHKALIPLLMVLLFFIILGQLFHLTIVKGSYYGYVSQENRIKEIKIEAPRGKIYDRKGVVIAESVQRHASNEANFISYERRYPMSESISHMLGYRQLASAQDIKNDVCKTTLEFNDYIGRSGVEKLFECSLRGISGKKLIETDAQGHFRKTLAIYDPLPGRDVTLSIDSTLQNIIHETIMKNEITTGVTIDLREHHIAVVASKPSTGEILALYSYPTFDPNSFEKLDRKMIASYLLDPEKPLFNRATLGLYPPGSVFKPFIAAAALEEKVIDKSFQVEDTGTMKAGAQDFGNWYFLQYGKKDGLVDIVKSLQRSNDIFYYTIGSKLEVDTIKKWTHIFGIGEKTGIVLEEAGGVVPSEFWKKETIKERWYLGDTFNLSIGQGYLLVTPLQINRAHEALANGGLLCAPSILKITKDSKPVCKKLPVSLETLDLIKQGMKKACETGGTAWPFFDWKLSDGTKIPTGCKTGTAESQKKGSVPHAWFTVYAPFDNPEIELTILVEEAGEGSNVAAPIAKTILTKYFDYLNK